MMMCDIFLDSLDMYLDVGKKIMIIHLLPNEILLVKVKHCSPQGKFPLVQKLPHILRPKICQKITTFGPSLRNPARKPSRNPALKPARVFTKGFTAENVKIFYEKLTSSGMAVPVLELDRRQGSSSPWGTCNAKHLMEGGYRHR